MPAAYSIPAETVRQLECMVDQIEQNPGRLVQAEDHETVLDMRGVLRSLPEGLSEEDFFGILKLALLTECATDLYANAISDRSRHYGAEWLARFNERVWVPDEYMHATPFKLALMGLGFSEAELDREMRETQEKEFIHVGGDTPVNICTFGMVQEYLTDHWHGLISKLLKPAAPQAAALTFHIKQRETLHMIWYRDMAAMQVAANPEMAHHVTYELLKFRLPGNSLIPELQSRAADWLPKMGADFAQVARDLIRHLHAIVASEKALGRLVVELAQEKDFGLAKLKGPQVRWALERYDGWAYGLVGEAVLERLGLSFIFKESEQNDLRGRLRARLRGWLAAKLPVAVA
jgi:hypothetical protein